MKVKQLRRSIAYYTKVRSVAQGDSALTTHMMPVVDIKEIKHPLYKDLTYPTPVKKKRREVLNFPFYVSFIQNK